MDNLKSDPRVLGLFQARVSLKKVNGEWVGKCPFHSDSTPSFHVNSKRGDFLYICFGCQASGSIYDFIQKMDNISVQEAIKKVRFELGDWGKTREVDNIFKPIAESEKPVDISYDTYRVMVKNLIESPEAEAYLKGRGISLKTAIECSVGFRHELPGRKEKLWLSIPTLTRDYVTGIKYRCITEKAFASQKGMVNGLFNSQAIDPFSPIFVCEGEADTLSFQEAGYKSVSIGAAGAKLTPEQKDQIMQADGVYLAGDADPPGQECMNRLWNDLKENTFLLTWPAGIKDSNELLMKIGIDKFKLEIPKLMAQARTTPMPYVKSLQESLATSNRTNLADHPGRLRFPWPSVDRMAILLPGSVMAVSATNTKMGKSSLIKDITLYNAFRGNTVLYYSCELSEDEFGTMVASGVLKKNRNHLTVQDNQIVAKQLGDANVRYYIGRNPTLTTVGPVLDLIESAVRRLGVEILILDHLNFICRNNERGAEVTDQANAMQRLKNMAVTYGLKTIVVSQPRKAHQSNRGKVMHITDFKGSEASTSDADAIFVMHRNEIRVKDLENPPMDDYDPRTEIHLLGARAKGDGPTFACLQFYGEFASFVELSKQENPQF